MVISVEGDGTLASTKIFSLVLIRSISWNRIFFGGRGCSFILTNAQEKTKLLISVKLVKLLSWVIKYTSRAQADDEKKKLKRSLDALQSETLPPHQIATQTTPNKTSSFGSVKNTREKTCSNTVNPWKPSTPESDIIEGEVHLDRNWKHRSPKRLIGQETISPGNSAPSDIMAVHGFPNQLKFNETAWIIDMLFAS